jgi:ABC-type Mn2+/Zn2+ transport system ATPase subunit
MRLEIDGLTVSYDRGPVLRSVCLRSGPGEVLGVVGPNGAGKTTLLRAVAGLLPITAGTVRLDGSPVSAVRGAVAYLAQRAEIDWEYPAVVRDLVTMGRYPHRRRLRPESGADRAAVDRALARVGLDGLARRPIGELSGGQRQRALLGRALAQEARLLLLDEPFVGVDGPTKVLLTAQLRQLRDDGATVVVVEHDLSAAPVVCDRLVVLSGRVVAQGDPHEVLTSESLSTVYGAPVPFRLPDEEA